MNTNSKYAGLRFFGIFVGGLAFDQLTKHFVPTMFFTEGIGFYRTTNTGAGFSLFSGNNTLLALITGAFIAYIGWYLWKETKGRGKQFSGLAALDSHLPLALILTGAVGNLMDRIFFGHVLDFIMIYSWPVFNLADTYLTLGVIWLLWTQYKSHKTEPESTK